MRRRELFLAEMTDIPVGQIVREDYDDVRPLCFHDYTEALFPGLHTSDPL